MRKKWKIIIGIILVLVIAAVVIQQYNKRKTAKAPQVSTEDTHTVILGDIISKIEITGEVQPQTVVSIKSRVSGKIVKLYADENDYVKAGQIIADIEPDYNQANTLFNTKAQLHQAEIRLKNATKDESDKKELLRQNYISQKEYDLAVDELNSAGISYKQASDQYELIRDLDTSAKVTPVYATASGMVIERKINEGEMVQSSINTFGEGTVVMKI
ncbi:MAG: efflux RND transporter periplasmic adaptor subunit, partial [Candidatus Cloacimonadaceae bacterium]|nr:efflux RND transporter periplasmic adaptor subunit [Candidatus Cloacimonadaceae bacterium]